MISYRPLWKTLEEKHITQYALIKKYGVSTGTLDSLRQNKNMRLSTIDDLCQILECSIEDIVEILPDIPDVSKAE